MFYNSDKGEFHKVKVKLCLLSYYITPESNIKVMRMKEMITN